MISVRFSLVASTRNHRYWCTGSPRHVGSAQAFQRGSVNVANVKHVNGEIYSNGLWFTLVTVTRLRPRESPLRKALLVFLGGTERSMGCQTESKAHMLIKSLAATAEESWESINDFAQSVWPQRAAIEQVLNSTISSDR